MWFFFGNILFYIGEKFLLFFIFTWKKIKVEIKISLTLELLLEMCFCMLE